MNCPPFTYLCAADADVTLGSHLSTCLRCRAIVARVQATEFRIGESASAEIHSADRLPQVGEVWTFWAPASDEYVVGAVLDAADVELLIVPIFVEITFATEADVVLSEDVLGYSALAP